jgi:hypothetical protein
LRAVDAGTERRMRGFSYVQCSGDDPELWGRVRYILFLSRSPDDEDDGGWWISQVTGKLPTVSSVFQGLASQLFWRNRAELLACSCEELRAAVVKLVAAARETEQTAPAPGRDGLHAGAWSALPTAVLKFGGRVLLCTLADLPRELELPASVPGPCEPPNNKETAFTVVHASSNATNPIDADDKTRPKPRSHDGEDTRPGAGAATLGGRSGDMSRVLRMNPPSGRRAQHVFGLKVLLRGPVRSRSQAHTSALGGKSVLQEDMRALVWRWYCCSCSLMTKVVYFPVMIYSVAQRPGRARCAHGWIGSSRAGCR